MRKHIMAAAAVGCMAAGGASAATLNGEFWNEPANSLGNISQAISAATARSADATFTSTGLNYGDASTPGVPGRPNNWAIGSLDDFLNADAGTINPASVATQDIQESVFRFTGQVALNNGDSIFVTSDDGFRLIIDGTTFSEEPGIRAPNNTTTASWTGASGVYSATLWFFEGNETQVQLISNLGTYAVAPVPVPAAGLLLLTGLGGLAALRRRRKAA